MANVKPAEPLQVREVQVQMPEFELFANFEVAPGERTALRGRSGSGKTTLLRLILGLDSMRARGASGDIRIGARSLVKLPPEKRNFGYVPQVPVLFPELDAIDNAAYGLLVRGMKRSKARSFVAPILDEVGLAHLQGRAPTTFSGGEKQRLTVIRALAFQPDALVLDEPFSSLDVDSRVALAQLIDRLTKVRCVPILFTTHADADIKLLNATEITLTESQDGRRRSFIR